MTESEYKSLCAACDQILSKLPKAIAVPWLHVIREHPTSLKIYSNFFRKKETPNFFFWIYLIGRALRLIATQLIRVTLKGGISSPRFYSNQIEKKLDVLYISHLLSSSQIRSENDAYYGPIPSITHENGYKSGIVYIDHGALASIKNILSFNKDKNIFILPSVSNFKTELKILYTAFDISISLLQARFNHRFDTKIIREAMLEALTPETCNAIRIQTQMDAIIEEASPNKIVLTWEGHAWERLVSALTKTKDRNIRCIAYQHAIISRLQHSSRRSLGTIYDPDLIWASGSLGKKMISRGSLRPIEGIQIIGSNRANPNISEERKKKIDEISILVVPEGLIDECRTLFTYALQCAKEDTELNFIWRLHPSLSFRILKVDFPEFGNLPENITLSNDSLDEDIQRSSHVLYRGSTAVIPALTRRIRPIYLKIPDEMTIDPLDELYKWKITIPITTLIKRANINKDESSEKDIEDAVAFGHTIYSKICEDKILASL